MTDVHRLLDAVANGEIKSDTVNWKNVARSLEEDNASLRLRLEQAEARCCYESGGCPTHERARRDVPCQWKLPTDVLCEASYEEHEQRRTKDGYPLVHPYTPVEIG